MEKELEKPKKPLLDRLQYFRIARNIPFHILLKSLEINEYDIVYTALCGDEIHKVWPNGRGNWQLELGTDNLDIEEVCKKCLLCLNPNEI